MWKNPQSTCRIIYRLLFRYLTRSPQIGQQKLNSQGKNGPSSFLFCTPYMHQSLLPQGMISPNVLGIYANQVDNLNEKPFFRKLFKQGKHDAYCLRVSSSVRECTIRPLLRGPTSHSSRFVCQFCGQ